MAPNDNFLRALGITAAAFCAMPAIAPAQQPDRVDDEILGRWDLVVEGPDGPYPSWTEIRLRTEWQLMAEFVGRFGSVRHAADVEFRDGRLMLRAPVQYERNDSDLVFEGMLEDGELSGTTVGETGETLRFTGHRAPTLARDGEPEWGQPLRLFNGKDLDGWRMRYRPDAPCWAADNGELVATPPCVDLVSEASFGDFRLQAEFRYPEGSNSGVYLRGRYEVQIQDDAGRALDALRLGGIYGFVTPDLDASRPAGEWNSLDVTLVGRRVSVVLNGRLIVDRREIPGITGGALDSDEAAPGPIMLQGDHGPIRYRNLVITPAR